MAGDLNAQAAVAAAIEPYRRLLEDFVEGQISADDFEGRYMRTYLSDDTIFANEVFDVVDAFFAEAESYVGDPELRARAYRAIGPDDLRQHAEDLLRLAGHREQKPVS
ncbi:MAG: colicin immunity domain-containing protein [Jatrophihabitans sp.]|uniref:colicin immunity domain-containing protein n=1 Tax=Jatrophihabitans sp. TaxID=1932789 RepID=UPI0039154895